MTIEFQVVQSGEPHSEKVVTVSGASMDECWTQLERSHPILDGWYVSRYRRLDESERTPTS